ncbi:hypothetical protein QBC43DRAFT_355224 [Cladorrhinum sp. PSN259]|nr:hypothetical protein QBC43DRAFT_355224 [Cladorrhinum sp. PSN259]
MASPQPMEDEVPAELPIIPPKWHKGMPTTETDDPDILQLESGHFILARCGASGSWCETGIYNDDDGPCCPAALNGCWIKPTDGVPVLPPKPEDFGITQVYHTDRPQHVTQHSHITAPTHSPTTDRNQDRKTFFSLPNELRNVVYSYLARYPTCQELYAGYNREVDRYYARKRLNPDSVKPFPDRVILETPTILLLCKEITEVVLPMFKAATFVVDQLPPWQPNAGRPMKLTHFISERTLQGLQKLEVYVPLGVGNFGGGWVWRPFLRDDIISILLRANALRFLGVSFSMHNHRLQFMFNIENRHLNDMELDLLNLINRNPRRLVNLAERLKVGSWTIKRNRAVPGIRDPSNRNLRPSFFPVVNDWVEDTDKLFAGGGMLEFL